MRRPPGHEVQISVDRPRREAIQRHHTVTHLLHWALHEVVSKDAAQKGSYVGPEKLTFDFSSAPLTPQQVADVERLVNERILENAAVTWTEVKYTDVKSRKDIMQFFGDKYGDRVRVVQIGGKRGRSGRLLDGTLRRHAHAGYRGDRSVPHRGRIRHRRRHPAHRGRIRPGGLQACERGIAAYQDRRRQGERARSANWKRRSRHCSRNRRTWRSSSRPCSRSRPAKSRAAWPPKPRPSARRLPLSRTLELPTAICCNPSRTRSRASSRA